jgi:hypothetical protein
MVLVSRIVLILMGVLVVQMVFVPPVYNIVLRLKSINVNASFKQSPSIPMGDAVTAWWLDARHVQLQKDIAWSHTLVMNVWTQQLQNKMGSVFVQRER